MCKKYRLGFDIWGLILFGVIMIPNFVWLVITAPNDILRNRSITPYIDMIASICQVLMIILLCILVRKDHKRIRITAWIVLTILCCIIYFSNWFFYFLGITNPIVILGLTIPPCLAFLFFAIDRENIVAIIPIVIFLVCHLIYSIINFII